MRRHNDNADFLDTAATQEAAHFRLLPFFPFFFFFPPALNPLVEMGLLEVAPSPAVVDEEPPAEVASGSGLEPLPPRRGEEVPVVPPVLSPPALALWLLLVLRLRFRNVDPCGEGALRIVGEGGAPPAPVPSSPSERPS